MHSELQSRLENALKVRREKGLLRKLRTPTPSSVDFSSNDYLGAARPGAFQEFLTKQDSARLSGYNSGATGSRLLSGHSKEVDILEHTAADFHGAEKSLFFNSGYDANLSVLSCLPGREDCIVYDEFIHASVHDGMRMSRAKSNTVSFRHNDVVSLREKIVSAVRNNSGSVLVCIETVYSMDGDVAPLREILDLSHQLSEQLKRDVHILADEAHAGGVYGEYGEGLAVAEHVNNHPNLLVRVVTFGKAFGAHGAVVLSSALVVNYLINYARPFIYSTALPPHSIATVLAAYKFAKTNAARGAREMLWKRVALFQRLAHRDLPEDILLPSNGQSPIQGILAPGNRHCVEISKSLGRQGFDVYPIRSPTVPRGSERIRIIVHAHNSEEDIQNLVEAIAKTEVQRAASL